MSDKYILNERGDPVREDDLMKWAMWFETADRTVARTVLPCPAKTDCLPEDVELDGVNVSTVFLGLDHNFHFGPGPKGFPVLWETLVFGGHLDGEMYRYCTRAEAEAGHAAMVERVRQAQESNP